MLCDPWIIGSCYWRSWWNYPPVTKDLIESLRPNFIYLTHIHWDHFHGPSLRKFSKTTTIFVPKGNYDRMKRDLNQMGFNDVRELRHGEKAELGPGFKITSYQFDVFLDSALIIECEGVTLLNANDTKFMGMPLRQILNRHPKIDFVLRSHSSANSRLCYEIMDSPMTQIDDVTRYIREFANFVVETGARYAVPFASNHCHLHRDVYRFNNLVQTPRMVADYFAEHRIVRPIIKTMVSGDSWSSEDGFSVSENEFFEKRDYYLEEYRRSKQHTLDKFSAQEARATVKLLDMETYFREFFGVIPFFLRRRFRGNPIVFVLTSGNGESIFLVDLWKQSVQQLKCYDNENHPIQIHTTAFIMRQCLKLGLFSHLSISKRVVYRVTSKTQTHCQLFNLIINLFEYEWLPIRQLFRFRLFETYLLRWREVILYFQLLGDILLLKKLDTAKYLKPIRRTSL